jgi:hypothetical protein
MLIPTWQKQGECSSANVDLSYTGKWCSDMIRFGKYEGTWTEKDDTDKRKRIFPIPQTAIDGSSNLPGYLEQNPSY